MLCMEQVKRIASALVLLPPGIMLLYASRGYSSSGSHRDRSELT